MAFLGWFGPRGAASIVFALIVVEEGGLPHDGLILTAAFVAVGLSVLAHGASAAPLAIRYANWLDALPADEHSWLESPVAPELRWRLQREEEAT